MNASVKKLISRPRFSSSTMVCKIVLVETMWTIIPNPIRDNAGRELAKTREMSFLATGCFHSPQPSRVGTFKITEFQGDFWNGHSFFVGNSFAAEDKCVEPQKLYWAAGIEKEPSPT